MKVQFETYSDREVILEASGRDLLLEIKNTGNLDNGKATFAYLTPETIVETLNKIPGFKVEYDDLFDLPKTENSIVKRGDIAFVRDQAGNTPWVRVVDGARFTDEQVAAGGDFEVVFVANEGEDL